MLARPTSTILYVKVPHTVASLHKLTIPLKQKQFRKMLFTTSRFSDRLTKHLYYALILVQGFLSWSTWAWRQQIQLIWTTDLRVWFKASNKMQMAHLNYLQGIIWTKRWNLILKLLLTLRTMHSTIRFKGIYISLNNCWMMRTTWRSWGRSVIVFKIQTSSRLNRSTTRWTLRETKINREAKVVQDKVQKINSKIVPLKVVEVFTFQIHLPAALSWNGPLKTILMLRRLEEVCFHSISWMMIQGGNILDMSNSQIWVKT